MPKFRFGNVTIQAPDASTASRMYNQMMASQNREVLAAQGLMYTGDANVIGPAAPPPEEQYYEDPGYGYEGSGYSSAPARPPYDVNADPAYQAFVAALDAEGSMAWGNLLTRTNELMRQRDEVLPRVAEQGIEQRRGISGAHESRGMFRSGERLRDIQLQQRGESQRVADIHSGYTRNKTELDAQFNAQVADLARRRAERALELTAANAY